MSDLACFHTERPLVISSFYYYYYLHTSFHLIIRPAYHFTDKTLSHDLLKQINKQLNSIP